LREEEERREILERGNEARGMSVEGPRERMTVNLLRCLVTFKVVAAQIACYVSFS